MARAGKRDERAVMALRPEHGLQSTLCGRHESQALCGAWSKQDLINLRLLPRPESCQREERLSRVSQPSHLVRV
jgi:hypothetical protein